MGKNRLAECKVCLFEFGRPTQNMTDMFSFDLSCAITLISINVSFFLFSFFFSSVKMRMNWLNTIINHLVHAMNILRLAHVQRMPVRFFYREANVVAM